VKRDAWVREVLVTAAFGFGAWLISAALTSIAWWIASPRLAYAVQIVLAPPIGVGMSLVYYRRQEALRPLFVAAIVGSVALLSTLALDRLFGRHAVGALGAVISTWFPVALMAITTFMAGLGASQPPRMTGSPPSESGGMMS
jgi:hypothetical protein